MVLDNSKIFSENLDLFYGEDDLSKNFKYLQMLPEDIVECSLKIKDDLILSGLPFFFESFNYLMSEKLNYKEFLEFEGKEYQKIDLAEIKFRLPFNIALTGERIALNLIQRSSAISTFTKKLSLLTEAKGIKLLDTRKTTPGLRSLEKYAVNIGGGFNHRFGQTEVWMVKDNHKSFFGGVDHAIKYFQNMKGFYTPIIVEIHDLNELELAYRCGVKHFMLDNFSPEKIVKAVSVKKPDMTYEVSGGISEHNIKDYLIEGVDAISSGSITYNAPHVDLSLKFKRSY